MTDIYTKKYIFPARFYILEASQVVKKEFLTGSEEFAMIDIESKNIYFLEREVKELLELFILPKSVEKIRAEYPFLNEDRIQALLEWNFLTEFSGTITPDMRPAVKDIFYINQTGYHTVKKIKTGQGVNVLVVKAPSGEQFVLKYVATGAQKFREVFLNEFKIYQLLAGHAAFCRIQYLDLQKQIALLEYINGTGLYDLVTKTPPSLQDKQKIIRHILDAYAFLHRNNIIHGDIHPGQVIVHKDLTVTLLDFGNACNLNEGENFPHVYKTEIHFFIEPENISADTLEKIKNTPYTFSGDVYKLGVLIYFILYGEYPFKDFTWKRLLHKIKTGDLILNDTTLRHESVPPDLLQLLSKCLSADPSRRFGSAIAIRDFLKKGE